VSAQINRRLGTSAQCLAARQTAEVAGLFSGDAAMHQDNAHSAGAAVAALSTGFEVARIMSVPSIELRREAMRTCLKKSEQGPPAAVFTFPPVRQDESMASRLWPVRSRVSVQVGSTLTVISLAWLTLWLLGKGEDGAGIANVLSLPLAAIGSVTAIYGLRSRPQADDVAVLVEHARSLLHQVMASETRTLQQLLGDTGDPKPADISFTRPEAALLRWRSDGGLGNGSLATIGGFYRDLKRGRLVMLGEAGAGKTVLAIWLLLELATAEELAATESPMTRIRVPVRLSIPAFAEDPNRSTPALVRDALDDWISEQLSNTYAIERDVARTLVRQRWVLPILDGLDEMDPDDEEPLRAWAILSALNLASGPGGWPVVLTCRTNRYRQLANASGSVRILQDATVITTKPLDVEQVVTWLTHRFPSGERGGDIQGRWRPVVAQLRRHPKGRLAQCLTSPLYLYLAVTAYQDEQSTPQQMCKLNAIALEDHLFARLIPAITYQYPLQDGSRYDASDVARWMQTLADHLAWMSVYHYSSTTLEIQELWQTGSKFRSTQRIRYYSATLITILALFPILTASVYVYIATGGDFVLELFPHAPHWIHLIEYFTSSIIIAGLIFRMSITRHSAPLQLWNSSAFTSKMLRRRFIHGLPPAFAIGLILMLISWFMIRPIGGYQAALAFGLTGGLMVPPTALLMTTLDVRQQSATRPSDPMRRALIRDLINIGACGLVVGLATGLTYGITRGLALGLIAGPLIGLGFGLAAVLPFSPWPRYALSVRSLHATADLPTRPGRFLDWAYDAGLIRLSGIAVQFRHHDLQVRLTTASCTSQPAK
jgi:hypothetical protein